MQSEEKELGHYQLKRLLGEGGFGEVYEAWDSKLHRSIAIKRLKPKMLSARPETLLDEARMAASLRHPAFVKIFSIDGDADQQSIIMEYVDGNTLRKMGEGEPLSEAVALDIVAQVAEAMQEAHASKLIHGDLKPSNLMLEASGTVRIMDFGLARRIDPQSTESVVLDDAQGTIAYLAPELLTGTRPNEQSDVYSLGVVLYEMVTGGRPFPHLNGLALAAAYMQSSSAAWPFPQELSPRVVSLIRAMTDRDVGARIKSMHSVRAQIGGILGSRPEPGPGASASAVDSALVRPTVVARLSGAFSAMKWRNGGAIMVAFVLALAIGAIALQAGWLTRITPGQSDVALMKLGMDSLSSFDRDESIETAIQSFSTVLTRRPDHAAAAAGLARAYNLRYLGDKGDPGWLQRADASAQRALELNDQLAFAHAAQGAIRFSQGRVDEALICADRALTLEPTQSYAYLLKIAILLKQNKALAAEQLIATAMAAHPRDRMFWDSLTMLRFAKGDYAGMEAAARKSIELEPDATMSYSNLSLALQHQDRLNEALEVLQRGLQMRPNHLLYQSLGSLLFSQGQYVEAAKVFEKGVRRNGSGQYLHWANLGDTLRWIPGREAEASDAYRQAVSRIAPLIARTPDDVTIISRLSLYQARLGHSEEAVRLGMRAIALAPESGVVRFRAAIVYELNGDRVNALAQLEQARLHKYPENLISSEPDLIALRRDPRYQQPPPESPR